MGGGCYRACAVGAPPTGEGFGLVVIDDPLRGREEADSAAHRDRAHEWYRGDMVARLEPGGSVVLVAARWHQDDLSGRLLAAEAGWEVLRLSALAEEGDPLGRRPGEALWPARYPAEALERIRREEGDRYFGALYQGSPSWGEGGMFLAGRAPVLDGDAPLLPAYLGLDLAYGGRDWTAGALLLGPAPESPRWRVAWVRRCRHEPAARDEELRSWRALAEAVDPEVIVVLPVDPSAGAEVAGRIAADVLPGARVRSARQRGSKEARAERLAAAWNAGEVGVCRGPWLAALLDELAAFPSGAYDDQVDALAAAFEAAHAAGESVGAVVGVGGRGYAPIRRTFGGAIIGRRRR
jgi:phage terminase large subunit-like protein